MINKITKRNGVIVDFNVLKIKKLINWSCQNLDILPEKLESELSSILREEISSKHIHESIIEASKKLISIDEPEWSIVSARLKLLEIYKEASKTRGYKNIKSFGYYNYMDFLKEAINLGLYDYTLIKSYSEQELIEASSFINEEYDYFHDIAGITALASKYLLKKEGKFFELPQELFLTLALYLKRHVKKNRLEAVKKTYNQLANRKLSLATPILTNLRKPNGNLSSCFITAMDDSLSSIVYVDELCAKISKNGGGVGVNLSSVRSKGAPVKGHPNASGGVIPWIKKLDNTANSVNQLGSRPGAITTSLDIWHRDIEQFLELQTENGDPRMKAFDIFPQVVIPDIFMQIESNDGDWFLFDPYEVKKKFNIDLTFKWGDDFLLNYMFLVGLVNEVYEDKTYGDKFKDNYLKAFNKLDEKDCYPQLVTKIKAKELFKHLLKSVVETGMPYVFFKDTANKYNPNQDNGVILSGNLCMESFSNTSPSQLIEETEKDGTIVRKVKAGDLHTCNLASINLAFVEEDELEEVIANGVEILDSLIDMTSTPVFEGRLHNLKYRTIGLGFMGYADYCVKHKTPYSRSSNLANKLFEKCAFYAYKTSINLAKERGVFEAYDKSQFKKGIILGKTVNDFKDSELPWNELFSLMAKHGIRNSQILAIAPNTSTSQLQGCSASILPVFGKFYTDIGKVNIPIVPPFIKGNTWLYQENKNINQHDVIEVISTIQKWIDTGISGELIINSNLDYVNAKYLASLFRTAWAKEMKTIYYVRSVQKDHEKSNCESCAN